MNLPIDEVKQIAKLARLKLTDEEATSIAREIEAVISFADLLAEVDTTDVQPTYHVAQGENVFREDVVTGSYDREVLLANAPSAQSGCYSVPKVVE